MPPNLGSAKTDPVRFKWGFGEGLLKDKFAFFEASKILIPKRRNLLAKRPFLEAKRALFERPFKLDRLSFSTPKMSCEASSAETLRGPSPHGSLCLFRNSNFTLGVNALEAWPWTCKENQCIGSGPIPKSGSGHLGLTRRTHGQTLFGGKLLEIDMCLVNGSMLACTCVNTSMTVGFYLHLRCTRRISTLKSLVKTGYLF